SGPAAVQVGDVRAVGRPEHCGNDGGGGGDAVRITALSPPPLPPPPPPPPAGGSPPPLRGRGTPTARSGLLHRNAGEGDHAKRGGGGGHKHLGSDAAPKLIPASSTCGIIIPIAAP